MKPCIKPKGLDDRPCKRCFACIGANAASNEVHRLTNDQDRETVERACGNLDRGAAQFVPMLAPGEAIVIGPELPAPVPVFIRRPVSPPDSKGPQFQKAWTERRQRVADAAAAEAADAV